MGVAALAMAHETMINQLNRSREEMKSSLVIIVIAISEAKMFMSG